MKTYVVTEKDPRDSSPKNIGAATSIKKSKEVLDNFYTEYKIIEKFEHLSEYNIVWYYKIEVKEPYETYIVFVYAEEFETN